jgi:mitogen-activated protein kinase kinase kinase
MIARARCPNIISFYGVSHSQGVTYIVTEFCPLALADEIARPAFDGQSFNSVALQVLRGIAYLHATGIAHRDVKPPNVLLQADGTVKLCDLGMSKFTDRAMTLNAGVVGSPCYMPPEAFSSLTHAAGPATSEKKTLSANGKAWDMYSLGVLFWWMWHGQEPFGCFGNIFAIADVVQRGARPAWFGYAVVGPDGRVAAEDTADGSPGAGVAPKALVELVDYMWSHDPMDRPSVTPHSRENFKPGCRCRFETSCAANVALLL